MIETLLTVITENNTVALDANIPVLVNALNAGLVTPLGDYGGNNVYYFEALRNGTGNIIYTVFDRGTDLGLASYTVRYGAVSTVRQVISSQCPRSSIALRHLVLPLIPQPAITNGRVIP